MIRVQLDISSPALRAGLRALLSSDENLKVINDSLEEDLEADVVVTSAPHTSLSNHSLNTNNELTTTSSAATLYS